MNNQIKELAMQAGFGVAWVEDNENGYPSLRQNTIDAFADIIIQECIKTLEFHGFNDSVPYIKWMATNRLGL